MTRGGTRPVWLAAIIGVMGTGVIVAVLWHMSLLSRHNTIRDLQEVPLNSTVHLLGTVTFDDDQGNRFWIQDDTGAMAINVNPTRAGVHVGQTVAIDATKTTRYDPVKGPASVVLKGISVRSAWTHVKLLEPSPATIESFPTPDKNGVQVQITGIVRAAGVNRAGQAELSLANSGPEIDVIVDHPNGDYTNWVGAKVKIVGLPEQARNAQGALLSNRLWVASGSAMQIEQPEPAQAPLYSIRRLYLDRAARNGNRIRIRGTVAAASPHVVLLEDRWGAIECHLEDPNPLKVASTVEVEGFPSRDGLRFDLFHASAATIPAGQVQDDGAPVPNLPLLTNLKAIRDLSPSQAAMALPVRVTGVATYVDPIWRQVYLQDNDSEIFLKYSGDYPDLLAGKRVTLTGITGAGDYAPVIAAPKLHVDGKAPMPVPVPVTANDAASGIRDSQYVTVEGVVHPMKDWVEGGQSMPMFDLFTQFGRVHVHTSPWFPSLQNSRNLEDARVRIRGVFGTVFNSRRQLVGYQFRAESRSDIDVIEPAVSNPFAMEITPIEDLLRFSSHARFGHRVKVKGTISLVEPDFMYLQDAGDGVEIQGDTGSFHVGEVVEAVGYPTLVGRYSPVLNDAVVRPTGSAGTVVPTVAIAESILRGHYDSMLVAVEGKLLTTLDEHARKILVLQSGFRTFTAQLDTSNQGANLPQFTEGSILRVTGICLTEVNPNKLYTLLEADPTNFQILTRSPEDLAVVRPAPLWTLRSVLSLLAAFSLLIPVTLLWVAMLRRRVRLQTAALQKASETAQAIEDLSTCMQNVSNEQRFDAQVSVRGSEDIARLVVGFNSMLAELRLRNRAKEEAEGKLQHMAMFDELTGLPNRRLLSDRLTQSLAMAQREGKMLALLYIDLDGFKLVNDNLGHSFGDTLLGQVAKRLRSRARHSDTLARIGGDEFTLILNDIKKASEAEKMAQSLLDALATPFPVNGHNIRIGASIGISIFPGDGVDDGLLLQQADCAMYAAKRNGKNRIVQFGDELGNAARKRLTLESELRRAVAEDGITVQFQPEFDLASNMIVRFEALARWTHPTLGVIPPLHFIPIAEENGLIVPLGAYIMERACKEAVSWQRLSNRGIQVAVNVSSVQFAQVSFIDEVEGILRRTGLDPSLLQIELTESATLSGIERAAESIRSLKSMGISVVIDDFGTGYSCLSYLPKLQFDALKIDRSFVNELMVRPETGAFVQSIIAMAHNLHMRVIVEGIETREQLQRVEALGADEAQGYLLGLPTADPAAQLYQARVPANRANEKGTQDLKAVS